jgi:hypothetical protein
MQEGDWDVDTEPKKWRMQQQGGTESKKRNVVRRKRVTTTQQTKTLQSADTEKRTYWDATISQSW